MGIFGKVLTIDISAILLLSHLGFRSRLGQGFNQCVRIFIDHKRGDRVVEGLLECSRSSFPLNATWQELVFSEGLHRPIVVGTKLALIDICPRRDRAFKWIKSFLSFFTPAPSLDRFAMNPEDCRRLGAPGGLAARPIRRLLRLWH